MYKKQYDSLNSCEFVFRESHGIVYSFTTVCSQNMYTNRSVRRQRMAKCEQSNKINLIMKYGLCKKIQSYYFKMPSMRQKLDFSAFDLWWVHIFFYLFLFKF